MVIKRHFKKNSSVALPTRTSEITVKLYRLQALVKLWKVQTEEREPQLLSRVSPADVSNIGKGSESNCNNTHAKGSQ